MCVCTVLVGSFLWAGETTGERFSQEKPPDQNRMPCQSSQSQHQLACSDSPDLLCLAKARSKLTRPLENQQGEAYLVAYSGPGSSGQHKGISLVLLRKLPIPSRPGLRLRRLRSP